jgi:hypothetical protein
MKNLLVRELLSRRQRLLQALQHQETVGEHDQRQVPMQAVPAPSLVVIEPAFLLGIDVKTARSKSGRGPASLTAPTRFLLAAC